MKEQSVIIIGGGLGGLFTGALLSKNGYRVTVLEKNNSAGGGLQTFVRNGEVFETGLHIISGFCPDGCIYKICNYLGIMDKLSFQAVDGDCMDELYCFETSDHYTIPPGREAYTEYLIKEFPHEREGIIRYMEALYGLTQEVDMFYMRKSRAAIKVYSEHFLEPADTFIARYIKDRKLQLILAYMNPLYGGMAGHTPAYIHALLNVLYINGPLRFVGGSRQLVDALTWVIESNHGKVMTNAEVTHIATENQRVSGVRLSGGEQISGDYYISAIHPCTMLELADENAFPKSYKNRLNAIPNTYSAFTVYLVLKPESFPYINHMCYCQDVMERMWDYDLYDETWPHGLMYMTPPVPGQGAYSRKMIITTPMTFNAVKKWEHTTVGKRGEEYAAWKEACAQKMIDVVVRIYPDIRDKIEYMYTSSPLTIRDYYGVKEGSMYGFRKDSDNIMLSFLPIPTKLQNLYLTGQNINLHGMGGVPLTAINTAEVLMGQGVLVDKINQAYEYEKKNG